MLRKLRLVVRTTLTSGEISCPLCGTVFELFHSGGILYDDSLPLGYICPSCFAGTPREAAAKVRARAGTLQGLVEQAEKNLADREWARLRQAASERAARWDDLADRLETLDSWPLATN